VSFAISFENKALDNLSAKPIKNTCMFREKEYKKTILLTIYIIAIFEKKPKQKLGLAKSNLWFGFALGGGDKSLGVIQKTG